MSEPIIVNEKNDKDDSDYSENDSDNIIHDFPSMFMNLFKSIPWKTSIYLFILMVILFSQQFIEHVLLPIGGEEWVYGDQPTNIGTIVLCIITVIGYMFLDLFVNSSIL